MSNPLLSIVVPTKNRYEYLYQLIDLLATFGNKDFEMVIQDNSDDNSAFLNKVCLDDYPFIRYFYLKEPLSQSDNSNKSILNSKGKYVCFIGDDDGVLPSIFDVVKYMEKNNIDALIPQHTVYNWPDYLDNSIYNISGAILYHVGTGEYMCVDPREEFKKSQQNGFRDMALMPRVYQAIVRRKCMDEVYEICGSFFPGPSPDMANAVALSNLQNTPATFFYKCPLIISGQSKNVGGGERLINKNQLKRIDEVPFLPKDVLNTWDRRIPIYWCSDTVWPASAISAYERVMKRELPININLVIARFIYDHMSYYKECIKFSKNKKVVFGYFIRFTIGRIVLNVKKFVIHFCSNRERYVSWLVIRNVNNIIEASHKLVAVIQTSSNGR